MNKIASFECNGSIYEICIANTIAMKEASFRFVYERYRTVGLEEMKSNMWCSIYLLLPKAVTLVIYQSGKLVATASITADSIFGIPADLTFENEINRRRSLGSKIVEVNSLAVDVHPRDSLVVFDRLINMLGIIGYYILNASELVITVAEHHVNFYKKRLGFELYDRPANYKKMKKDSYLLSYQHDEADSDTRSGYLFEKFYSKEEEIAMLEKLQKTIKPITKQAFNHFYQLHRLAGEHILYFEDLSKKHGAYFQQMTCEELKFDNLPIDTYLHESTLMEAALT